MNSVGSSLLAWSALDTRIAIVAVATVTACALIGSMLVLRRMSMMGDAIAHSVLPGLVIAFLWSGSLDANWMLLGAFGMGLLTTWLIQSLQDFADTTGDSAMGVVFTSLFALGVLLSRIKTDGQVDLDVDCVLYGSLATIVIDTTPIFGFAWPTSATILIVVVVANLAALVLLWKEFRVAAFDPQFAAALGLHPTILHYLIMALTAMTAVAAFQAVGSILVIAMLIVPAATAHLLTDRLSRLVVWAVFLAILAAACGLALTKTGFLAEAEPAALIAVCAGAIYLITMLCAPRYGLLGNRWDHFQRGARIMGEDLLAMFFRLEEIAPNRNLGTGEAVQAIGGGARARYALWRQTMKGNVVFRSGTWRLTDQGRAKAARVVRSHRLWEAWLVRHLGLPADHVHGPAERMEHYIGEQMESELRDEFAAESLDPHGREIPR